MMIHHCLSLPSISTLFCFNFYSMMQNMKHLEMQIGKIRKSMGQYFTPPPTLLFYTRPHGSFAFFT